MPGIPAVRRAPTTVRSRTNGRTPQRRAGANQANHDGPPPKKRRYVPGGPGGGGRYVDVDGTEVPVGGTGPGGYNYIGPRGRIGPQNAANGIQPVAYERPRRESRRERPATRPRYSSAAAAVSAVVQGDPFKPREERGWEEFHQDLDIDAKLPVFSADEIDGVVTVPMFLHTPLKLTNGNSMSGEYGDAEGDKSNMLVNGTGSDTPGLDSIFFGNLDDGPDTPSGMRRRPGRPPRRPDFMLKGIGTPDIPKLVPLPGPNPREKLTLPKPSFRRIDPFLSYEQNAAGQLNYVDRTMANVGYQESDIYTHPDKSLIRMTEGIIEEELDLAPPAKSEAEGNAAIGAVGVGRVEYDMDEQDEKWLDDYNVRRKAEQVEPIKPAIFEITMTKIEKEWHALEKRIPKPNPKPPQTHRPRSSSAAAVNGEPAGEEQDSKCAICDDGDCENTNAIVFCDGCDLAVHQECYGVPFIPEGQWLCRKCQLIGRGVPTCIFCPNIDGAFKQTNSSKWSHLLCAIWIPEVSLGNQTFMEPVMDVEKVPKQRWKLTCYICRQKMGACIQCGNKNCFVAFHVSCARRAKLFLQMKSVSGGPAALDSNLLKAFCDKHVPDDWREEHDTDMATTEAIDFYRWNMRGKRWADSQQSALNMVTSHAHDAPIPTVEEATPKTGLVVGNAKRKRSLPPKNVWRLPSGAPVIPSVVYDSVENSLQRFTVRKRRDFASDMCKYWTLKREARRGAALIKRLQLQMETFSSMEITRRNFVGMGAAGRVRLQRRIDFATERLEDVEKLRALCEETRNREREKLTEAELLKEIIDIVYFPIPPLLWPIIAKAQLLNGKGTFRAGLAKIRERVDERFYVSVSPFSADLATVFSSVIGMSTVADTAEVESQIIGDRSRKDLSSEQKEKRKLAKRIIKAIQPALTSATHKESELCRRPFEKELRDLDMLLETSFSSRRDSSSGSLAEVEGASDEEPEDQKPRTNGTALGHANMAVSEVPVRPNSLPNGAFHGSSDMEIDNLTAEGNSAVVGPVIGPQLDFVTNGVHSKESLKDHQPTPEDSNPTPMFSEVTTKDQLTSAPASRLPPPKPIEPPTPPLSSGGDLQIPLTGGIPWYMDPFDPTGTTLYEERWTGRDVARDMSEELSDMDEEELSGLVDNSLGGGVDSMDIDLVADSAGGGNVATAAAGNASARKKNGKPRRRWKGFR